MASRQKTTDDKAKAYADKIEQAIKEYPFTTMALSIGAGVLLSRLFSKKR
ncbi:MAG: hypothetical protein ACLFTH_04520 [Candidatus Woesearchaeota archaeon]